MSKSQPFSRADEARIIHTLAENGTWNGERAGRRVTLWRQATTGGQVIRWRWWRDRQRQDGQAPTVRRALEALNAALPARAAAERGAAA